MSKAPYEINNEPHPISDDAHNFNCSEEQQTLQENFSDFSEEMQKITQEDSSRFYPSKNIDSKVIHSQSLDTNDTNLYKTPDTKTASEYNFTNIFNSSSQEIEVPYTKIDELNDEEEVSTLDDQKAFLSSRQEESTVSDEDIDLMNDLDLLMDYQISLSQFMQVSNTATQEILIKLVDATQFLIKHDDRLQSHFLLPKLEATLPEINLSSTELMLWRGLETSTKIALITTCLPIILLPLDVWQTRLHLGGTINIKELAGLFFSMQTGKGLLRSLGYSQKICAGKNTITSHKETIAAQFEDKENNLNAKKALKNILNTLKTSGIMAGFELLFTHKYSNARIYQAAFKKPVVLKTLNEKFRFMLQGIGVRYTRNFSIAFGCISSSTLFQSIIDEVLPKETFPYLNQILPALLAGAAMSPISNALDILYKNQIKAMNSEFHSPSILKIFKSFIKDHGYHGLAKGSRGAFLQMTISFLVINVITDFVSTHSNILMERHKMHRYFQHLRQQMLPSSRASNTGFFKKLHQRYEIPSNERSNLNELEASIASDLSDREDRIIYSS